MPSIQKQAYQNGQDNQKNGNHQAKQNTKTSATTGNLAAAASNQQQQQNQTNKNQRMNTNETSRVFFFLFFFQILKSFYLIINVSMCVCMWDSLNVYFRKSYFFFIRTKNKNHIIICFYVFN